MKEINIIRIKLLKWVKVRATIVITSNCNMKKIKRKIERAQFKIKKFEDLKIWYEFEFEFELERH